MRAAFGWRPHHVVRGDRGLLDGIAPVLDGDELAVKEGVWPAGDVAGDEDVVEHNPLLVEDAARSVANDPAGIGSQTGPAKPLRIADGAEGDHDDVDVEHVAVREPSPAQRSRLPPAPSTVTPLRRSTP